LKIIQQDRDELDMVPHKGSNKGLPKAAAAGSNAVLSPDTGPGGAVPEPPGNDAPWYSPEKMGKKGEKKGKTKGEEEGAPTAPGVTANPPHCSALLTATQRRCVD